MPTTKEAKPKRPHAVAYRLDPDAEAAIPRLVELLAIDRKGQRVTQRDAIGYALTRAVAELEKKLSRNQK